MKLNCWEYLKCGRQPGGEKAEEFGPCPAATATSAHGINSGVNGGRACWAISSTLCGDVQQGTYVQKLQKCIHCDFYSRVRSEESGNYAGTKAILNSMRKRE